MTSDSIIKTNALIPYLESILANLKNSKDSTISYHDMENVLFALYQIEIWKRTPESRR